VWHTSNGHQELPRTATSPAPIPQSSIGSSAPMQHGRAMQCKYQQQLHVVARCQQQCAWACRHALSCCGCLATGPIDNCMFVHMWLCVPLLSRRGGIKVSMGRSLVLHSCTSPPRPSQTGRGWLQACCCCSCCQQPLQRPPLPQRQLQLHLRPLLGHRRWAWGDSWWACRLKATAARDAGTAHELQEG
jgi:hypothetical protein